MLRISLTYFPKTFTIGEAMIVVQSIVLYGLLTVAKLLLVFSETDDDIEFIHAIVTVSINIFYYTISNIPS